MVVYLTHKALGSALQKKNRDLNKLENILVHIKRFYIVKVVVLPKLIYRFSTIYIRIPASFFVEIDKLILKLTRNCKGSKIVKVILKSKKTG
jgi:hypothetical protein